MRTLLLLAPMLLVPLSAQTLTIPNAPAIANVDRPFAGGIGRYQQWYSAASLATGFTQPIRLEKAEFFAGPGQASITTTLDLEVAIGHGWAFGTTGLFDGNFSSPPVVVRPRGNVTLSAGASGAVVLVIDFTTRFTWDGVNPIMMDIKIFGNGRGNQPFSYDNLGTNSAATQTQRIYQFGSAVATSGQWQNGIGLITRFTGRPGSLLEFGAGCPGALGFVPVNYVQQIPSPGITWTHQLQQAASQRLCMWVLGASNTSAGPIPLPADLGQLLGLGPWGCSLLVDPVVTLFSTTVGGGAGGGIASISLSMPPVTSYVGLSLYSQWVVSDPNSINGQVAVSPGIWSIVAPVGG